MRYVSAAEMKQIDRAAIEKYGVSAAMLMEHAGEAVVREAVKFADSGNVLVVCGYGNNGGDGFVAARHLFKKGLNVTVLIAGRPRPFSVETGDNLKILIEAGCVPHAAYDTSGINKAFAAATGTKFIIDALFGIGIKGPLDSFYVTLIEKINSAGVPVISADLPSGLDADKGTPCPVAVRASKTVTFGISKEGFNNPLSQEYTGQIVVADIGIPQAAVDEVINKRRLL